MSIRELYDKTECNTTVILRTFDGANRHKDTILTNNNIDKYDQTYHIGCIVPYDKKIIIEV